MALLPPHLILIVALIIKTKTPLSVHRMREVKAKGESFQSMYSRKAKADNAIHHKLRSTRDKVHPANVFRESVPEFGIKLNFFLPRRTFPYSGHQVHLTDDDQKFPS